MERVAGAAQRRRGRGGGVARARGGEGMPVRGEGGGAGRDWAGLPLELLGEVAKWVPPEDRFCFRLTCSSWAEAGGSLEGGGGG